MNDKAIVICILFVFQSICAGQATVVTLSGGKPLDNPIAEDAVKSHPPIMDASQVQLAPVQLPEVVPHLESVTGYDSCNRLRLWLF